MRHMRKMIAVIMSFAMMMSASLPAYTAAGEEIFPGELEQVMLQNETEQMLLQEDSGQAELSGLSEAPAGDLISDEDDWLLRSSDDTDADAWPDDLLEDLSGDDYSGEDADVKEAEESIYEDFPDGESSAEVIDEMFSGEDSGGEDLSVWESIDEGLTEEEFTEESVIEEMTEEEPALGSMLPLEEIDACIVLSGYTDEQLKSVPLSTILNMLTDSEGNAISVPVGATTVWTYFKDDQDTIIHDEYHAVGSYETVDLSIVAGVTNYKMEMIIGDGMQLSPDNKRYLVRVFLTDDIPEKISFELYDQDAAGNRTKVIPTYGETTANSQLGFQMESTIYTVPGHVNGKEYYLGITSEESAHPYVHVEVYPFMEYMMSLYGMGSPLPITDQILNLDMSRMDEGYCHSYDVPTTVNDTDTAFVLTYTDHTGRTRMKIVSVAVVDEASHITGRIEAYDEESGTMRDVTCFEANSVTIDSLGINAGTGGISATGVHRLYYMLQEDCDPDDSYYCTLNAFGVTYGDAANSYVVRAVSALCNTLEEAYGYPDIRDQLIPVDQVSAPHGYKANYHQNSGIPFTIFFEDGTIFKYVISIIDYDPKYDDKYVRAYSDSPVVGEVDPWFRVKGLKLGDRLLDTYVIENGKAINMDTYYGYGYQTVMVNEILTDEQMSRLKPVFEVADPGRVRVQLADRAGDLTSGVSEVDFSGEGETVHFVTGIMDKDGSEHAKNYYVRVLCKRSGPALYVYDGWVTTTATYEGTGYAHFREVLLDEYFEEKHDILIANIGDEPLTGLRVSLNASGVKLDDYWVVGTKVSDTWTEGGSGNDTLAPFTQTKDLSEYGMIDNVAKIRLVPDGTGDRVEGTLYIYADGGQSVRILISDTPRQPEIVTRDELESTVRFVPYSFYISTNNMYDWNRQTFMLVSGALPEGMTLNPSTGEIYGAPAQTGEFNFEVGVSYSDERFDPSVKEFTITVLDNDDETVFRTSSDGYQIIPEEDGLTGYIGERVSDSGYGFELVLDEENAEDEWFISNGAISDFEKLWLNGVELAEGVDYFTLPGSTMIRIPASTVNTKVNRNGINTISAEFRVRAPRTDSTSSPTTAISRTNNREIRRTSQNFMARYRSSGSGSGGSGDGSGNSGNGGSGASSGTGAAPSYSYPAYTYTPEPVMTTIRLNKTSAVVYKGKTLKLTAVTNRHVSVRWTTSNKKVATVKNGKIKGKKKGTAVITAITSDGKRASCKVSVEIPVRRITLNRKTLTLKVGKKAKLKASVSPKGASKKGLTWKSSNPKVASVSNGMVKALRKGKCTITVKAPNGKKARCKVKVYKTIAVKGISLDQTQVSMYQGDTLKLNAALTPANATNQTITWTSSNPAVVSVTDGLLTALSPGTAAVSATTHNGKMALCLVSVSLKPSPAPIPVPSGDEQTGTGQDTEPTAGPSGKEDGGKEDPGTGQGGGDENPADTGIPARRVLILPPQLALMYDFEPQRQAQLTPVLYPEDTTDGVVRWLSSNAAVVTVTDGTVTAVSPGYAFIVAETSNGIRGYCLVTVDSFLSSVSGTVHVPILPGG